MKKNFNEDFAAQFSDGNYNVKDNITGLEPHVGPDYVGLANSSAHALKNMKDDFKDQDAEVKKFLSAQELEEKPKKIKSTPQLKAMKLAESKKIIAEGLFDGYDKTAKCMFDFAYNGNDFDELILQEAIDSALLDMGCEWTGYLDIESMDHVYKMSEECDNKKNDDEMDEDILLETGDFDGIKRITDAEVFADLEESVNRTMNAGELYESLKNSK